jgi:hypothetical protein
MLIDYVSFVLLMNMFCIVCFSHEMLMLLISFLFQLDNELFDLDNTCFFWAIVVMVFCSIVKKNYGKENSQETLEYFDSFFYNKDMVNIWLILHLVDLV